MGPAEVHVSQPLTLFPPIGLLVRCPQCQTKPAYWSSVQYECRALDLLHRLLIGQPFIFPREVPPLVHPRLMGVSSSAH